MDYMSLVGMIEDGAVPRVRRSLEELHRGWCQFKHKVVEHPICFLNALGINGTIKVAYAGILSPVLLLEEEEGRVVMVRAVPLITTNGSDSDQFDVVVTKSYVATIVKSAEASGESANAAV